MFSFNLNFPVGRPTLTQDEELKKLRDELEQTKAKLTASEAENVKIKHRIENPTRISFKDVPEAMIAKLMHNQDGPTFCKFMDLPKDLRLMVWDLSMAPRLIPLDFSGLVNRISYDPEEPESFPAEYGIETPVALRICRESRAAAQALYGEAKKFSQEGQALFFSKSRDTYVICGYWIYATDLFFTGFEAVLKSQMLKRNLFNQLESLGIPYGGWSRHPYGTAPRDHYLTSLARMLAQLPSLRELALFVYDQPAEFVSGTWEMRTPYESPYLTMGNSLYSSVSDYASRDWKEQNHVAEVELRRIELVNEAGQLYKPFPNLTVKHVRGVRVLDEPSMIRRSCGAWSVGKAEEGEIA